ncbi:MAG: hypothetical protein LIO76_08390 [Clostridiales bacterium]|nr:hypothetical protein [Clostridiales bacterium]
MKVFRRILIKLVILIVVIALFGGAAYVNHYWPQSSSQGALEEYLSLLIENNAEEAYERLDQSESTVLTLTEYQAAVQAWKYALYESCQTEEISVRQGSNGDSYADYHVEFLNSSDEVQLECDITLKKQSDAILGMLDQWKVLPDHCLVTGLRITVPAGSTLYLDGEEADSAWIVAGEEESSEQSDTAAETGDASETDGTDETEATDETENSENTEASKVCYELPGILPQEISVTVRHPILESLEAMLDPLDGDVDYSESMDWKESANSSCMELAVSALKQIYTAAVTLETDTLDEMFSECLEDVTAIVESQSEEFYREDDVTHPEFESVGIYDYEADFEEPIFTDAENGRITAVMTFTYHYAVHNTERVETGDIWADGENAWEYQTVSYTGKAAAEFVLSYYEDEWHIEAVTLPVIPESE